MTVIVFVAFIWGIHEKQLFNYISSFLTILGIAFFAQWSLPSNITVNIILCVNYPVKIDDSITMLEKDNNITGEISDIDPFYHLKNTTRRVNYHSQCCYSSKKHKIFSSI